MDKAVKEIGKNVTAVGSDCVQIGRSRSALQRGCGEKGRIDIFLANGGIVETVETPAVTSERSDRTFNINARGVYFTVQNALPLLNDGATIILTGSVVGQKGIPIYSTYAATKAALRFYVGTWAAEFGSQGIRANVISPGPIKTLIVDRQFPTREAADVVREQFKSHIRLSKYMARIRG